MKISNSKKELARIISENGGWREVAKLAVFGPVSKKVRFSRHHEKPVTLHKSRGLGLGWEVVGQFDSWMESESIHVGKPFPNWHQTILSRAEYFHLYPTPDADGWIEWSGGECPVDGSEIIDIRFSDSREEFGTKAKFRRWCHGGDKGDIIAYRLHKPETEITHESDHRTMEMPKPSIEQLAELVAAGKALGLVLSVTDTGPELVITDWRDLRVGDVIEVTGSSNEGWGRVKGKELTIKVVRSDGASTGEWLVRDNTEFRIIRRP